MGEQPLHAVPLLQFHNKRRGAASNDFSMPHWINLSFYSSSKRIGYSTFLPRIKMAPILNKESTLHKNKTAGTHNIYARNNVWFTVLSLRIQDYCRQKRRAQSKLRVVCQIQFSTTMHTTPKYLRCP